MNDPDIIEKTMSLSPEEFHRSIAVLDSTRRPAFEHRLDYAGGSVTITYVALPDVTLGTLLALPRARVLLLFENMPPDERAEFLSRFDLTFRRGGG